MAITLRTNKGTALSYDELDVNFSSVFYSASLSTDGKPMLQFSKEYWLPSKDGDSP